MTYAVGEPLGVERRGLRQGLSKHKGDSDEECRLDMAVAEGGVDRTRVGTGRVLNI